MKLDKCFIGVDGIRNHFTRPFQEQKLIFLKDKNTKKATPLEVA
jgi:hypothetical protein